MSISMYQASAPVFDRSLGNLTAILTKAAAWAEGRKINPAVLLAARLAPDMFPLTRQIQIACDFAKGTCARLAAVEPPRFEDNEASFDDFQARIASTRRFVATLTPAQIDGSETRQINVKAGQRELSFKGLAYLTGYALPNFYFHYTTAYAILRHNGLELSKPDFIGLV
ncbi:MAG: DUF1993 domain-containing protein [Gammaproteobacteria bacterium]|nr:DUF1993 domain-containing protein [Gammaproteobacteria bacterium]